MNYRKNSVVTAIKIYGTIAPKKYNDYPRE
nr:MAG TPA: hypothetical protein [Caudoviricetes sp.]